MILNGLSCNKLPRIPTFAGKGTGQGGVKVTATRQQLDSTLFPSHNYQATMELELSEVEILRPSWADTTTAPIPTVSWGAGSRPHGRRKCVGQAIENGLFCGVVGNERNGFQGIWSRAVLL